ncbi:MAG: hypothetical protein AABY05_02280 [Nanoarchaeota archaeon]
MSLASLVVYVKGPLVEKPSKVARVLGKTEMIAYYFNPQFYYGINSFPLVNYGVRVRRFKSSEALDRESFKSVLKRELEDEFKEGIRLNDKGPIVPPEAIEIKIEYE